MTDWRTDFLEPGRRAVVRLFRPDVRIVTGGIAFYALFSIFPLIYLTLTLLTVFLPPELAKELATLDRLSGGRVELGIGIGWLREEFEALGVPWEQRGARSDEYVAALRALWSGPHAEFHGKFVDFAPVTCSPRPVQKSIPILVGGDTEAAIQRAVRIADGYFPGEGDAARLGELIARLRRSAERAGRDPRAIEINAMFGAQMADPVAGAQQLAALGVDRAMVPAFFFAGPGGLDRLDAFAERVVRGAGV